MSWDSKEIIITPRDRRLAEQWSKLSVEELARELSIERGIITRTAAYLTLQPITAQLAQCEDGVSADALVTSFNAILDYADKVITDSEEYLAQPEVNKNIGDL